MISQVYSHYSQLLKAMSHPRRLEIIHLLRDQELCVTDIYSMLDLPQANISQHLTNLRSAGIVQNKRVGKQIYYSLVDAHLIDASDILRNFVALKVQDRAVIKDLSIPLTSLTPLTHDPVCKMQISTKSAAHQYTYHQHTYYFCASGCYQKFKNNPANYMSKKINS
jgi:ArsR family transcriptional regulator, arsenate/arsenite/antimonite-responsive transcriptional repressor